MTTEYKTYSVRIYNNFYGKELTGQFIAQTEQEAITAAKDHYAMSLDTETEEIIVVNTTVV